MVEVLSKEKVKKTINEMGGNILSGYFLGENFPGGIFMGEFDGCEFSRGGGFS